MADITNLEWIQQHNAELSNILKAVKTPAVNGTLQQLYATADI